MPFVVGQVLPSATIAAGAAATFDLPQFTVPGGDPVTGRSQYPYLVIMCPVAPFAIASGDGETTRYVFDGVADSNSLVYDTEVGHAIAIPADARTISVYLSVSTVLSGVVAIALGSVR